MPHSPIVPHFSRKAVDPHPATPNSDDALALQFVESHGADWRHVPAMGGWLRWTGAKWVLDETGKVRDLVRRLCREAARTADNPREARRISSNRTIAEVLKVAATDQRIACRTGDWDSHPMMLNTPEGVVDLEKGGIVPHDPELMITQIASARPGGPCPLWQAFLDKITAGDSDLRSYLARLAGYCLTGDTSEQVFVFIHGSGANGKSVFVNTIASVLGDYAATATLDTFLASRRERHLTELAGLRAARLVIVPETERGRAWAEARIKSVTGGETIRANFMRRDHFEFTPQFKLIVAGNHRPSLAGVGEAMRRRLHLVPFDVVVPPEDRDKRLSAKLLEERDGILRWMLDGCADWRVKGLDPPASVLAAADKYFDEEDHLRHWIEECCSIGKKHRATAHSLFESWSSWAERAGYQPGSQKSLGGALREHGFASAKVNGQRGWHGIAPRTRPPFGTPEE